MKLDAIPLSNLASVNSGGGAPQDPSAFTTTGFPFVRAGSLPKLLDGEDEGSLEQLEPEVAEEHGLSLFPAGTVLFAKSGMSATKGHVYRLKTPAYVVNHLAALIPHAPEDSAFLVRVLQRFSPTTLIKDAAYPSIRLGDIENMKVLAPPDSNGRRRIAELLDKADELRAKRRAALAQLDTLTQSIFLDMFGDPATNPKGPEGWLEKEIGEVAREVYRYPTYYDIAYVDDGVPEVRGELLNADGSIATDRARLRFISRETSARFPKTVLAAGDLVMTVRGTIGKMGLVPPELAGANITANLIRIAFDQNQLDPIFAWHSTQTSHFKAQLSGACSSTTILTIKAPDLKRIRIPLPPIHLQREFAGRVTALKAVKADQLASREGLDALFASLQHRAFRGEL